MSAVDAKKDAELIDANNDRPLESHRKSLMARQETERDDCEDIQPSGHTILCVTQERDSLQFDYSKKPDSDWEHEKP